MSREGALNQNAKSDEEGNNYGVESTQDHQIISSFSPLTLSREGWVP
jgi:hypothetical protein